MYWLDGSSKLPFVPRCSYILSSSRARAFAQAEALIEDQARILKSCVKIANFDYWCIEASELVDLVIDFASRDEKYLRRDGLSTREEGSVRISNLNSQFVNLICFSTFERAVRRLRANSRSTQSSLAPLALTTTSLLRGNTLTRLLSTPNEATRTDATPSVSPSVPRHHRATPRSSTLTPTVTSCRHERPSTDRVASPTRVSKEEGEERRGKKERERREMRDGEREGVRQELSKPPPPPPPTNGAHTQGDGKRRRRRRRCRRHCRYHCTAPNPPLAAGLPKRVPTPTKHPGKHHPPPRNRVPPPHHGGNHPNRRRPRHRRRRHRRWTPTTTALGVPPPNPSPLSGMHPPPTSNPSQGRYRGDTHHPRPHCRFPLLTPAWMPGAALPPEPTPSPGTHTLPPLASSNNWRDTAPNRLPRHRPALPDSSPTPTAIASHNNEGRSIDPLVGARVKGKEESRTEARRKRGGRRRRRPTRKRRCGRRDEKRRGGRTAAGELLLATRVLASGSNEAAKDGGILAVVTLTCLVTAVHYRGSHCPNPTLTSHSLHSCTALF
jgi:hypothetical protein